MIQYLKKTFYIIAEQKITLFWLITLFLLTSVIETLGIGLIGPFINLASSPEIIRNNHLLNSVYEQFGIKSERQFIAIIGLAIISIFYIKSLISFKAQSFVFRFSYDQSSRLSTKLLQAYLRVPYTFHLKKNSALLIQNIISETYTFSNGIMIPMLTTTANLIVVFFLTALLVKTSIHAVIAIFFTFLFAFIPVYWFRDKVAAWGKDASQANAEVIRIINHGLGSLKETKVIGCEPYFENQITQQTLRHAKSATASLSFSITSRIIVEAFLITFLLGFISFFLIFTDRNPQELNSVLGVFALASIRLLPAISNSMATFSTLKNNSFGLNKLYFDLKELEKAQININSGEVTAHQVIPFSNKISVESISYTYPGSSEPSLNEISLTIKKGQSIALIGKSGAGKTTLVDVFLGLLIPEKGDIKIDGVSAYDNLRLWQNMVGYIPQSIFLMDDTIEKNIAFGVPDHLIDSDRINKAIKAAQLEDLVSTLPDGIKTSVGERGVRLSGGQRQRIGIARALYHEREILVLDEATAALDNETESLVTEAIKSLSGTKTIIIIAHRLSTIEHCDCVYSLEKGHIVKTGSYEEVVLNGTAGK